MGNIVFDSDFAVHMEKKYKAIANGQTKKFVINKIEHDNQIKAHSRSIASFIAAKANQFLVKRDAIMTPQIKASLNLEDDQAFFETMNPLSSRTHRDRPCHSEKASRRNLTKTMAQMPN